MKIFFIYRWIKSSVALALILLLPTILFGASQPTAVNADRGQDNRATRVSPNGPSLTYYPISITFPAWTKMNRPYNQSLTLTNDGDEDLVYSITEEEDPPVPAGISSFWLSTSGFAGIIPSGSENADTGLVTITPAGGNPAGIYTLSGRLILTGNWPSSPDTIWISFIVADTLYPPESDTVHTPVLSLVATNTASIGEMGLGGVNMDYVTNGGDCDASADVYLYTGSPIIGYINDAGDTVVNFSAFGNDYFSPVGFLPFSNRESYDTAGCEAYRSVCLTRDSSLAVRTTLMAPTTVLGTPANFVLKRIEIWSRDGRAHNNVTVGEVIDWDVPSDSVQNNGSDFNATEKMIWQYGGEYHQDDTGANPACQDSDGRFAGIKFLYMKKNQTLLWNLVPVNAYTADNATWVYGNDWGFLPSQLFRQMNTKSGFSKYESAHPDSTYTDLHMVVTFSNNMSLGAADTVTVWMALITVKTGTAADFATAANRAKDLVNAPDPCLVDCYPRGELQCDGQINVSDLTYMVNLLFKGGPPICCGYKYGDLNCDNKVIVSDLTYFVNYLFKGGPAPCPCA